MRFQLTSALGASILLAASALNAAAFEAVTVEPAELREGPGFGFVPIVELPPGSIVEVLNCDRRWCEVGIEDYDGFLPRGVLDLGTYQPPVYLFPPLISQPSLWHGRYYSRDHYRYESRSRWRDREGRRIYVIPERRQPRSLPPPLIRPLRPDQPARPGVVPSGPQRRDILPQPKGPRAGDRVTPPGQPPAPRVAPPPPPPQRQIQPPPAPDAPRAPRVAPPPAPRAAPSPPAPRAAPPPASAPRAAPPPSAPPAKKKGEPGPDRPR